jgi:hypothetical protein
MEMEVGMEMREERELWRGWWFDVERLMGIGTRRVVCARVF